MTPWGLASGLPQMGMGLAGMFGNQKSPADAADPYFSQIGQQTGQYYDPYINAGKGQIPGLQEQYNQLMNNPGGKLNDIGGNFQQSPGFKFALQQALQGSGNAAAAGGMAGSPQHEQQNMQLATDIGNQDYYNWLKQATGLYGQGLEGGQNMMNTGANAANSQANMVAQQLALQGQNAYKGQQQQNNAWGNAFGNVLGGAGQALFG
jgi:hypothetical protein